MRGGVPRWVYQICAALLFTLVSVGVARPAIAADPVKPITPKDEAEPGAAKQKEAPVPGSEPISDIGRPCDREFKDPCPQPLVCVDLRCVPRTSTTTRSLDDEPDPDTLRARRAIEAVRPFRLGMQSSFFFGFGGAIKNPRPAYTLTADFGFPTGRRARWHVELGYADVNGYNGFRVNPFVLGYSIPFLSKPLHLEVEVLAAILQSEILFNDGFSIALSSGLRAQIVAVYGIAFAAFAPIGFEIRYAYGVQDIGVDTGVGANWPLQLTIGVEL